MHVAVLADFAVPSGGAQKVALDSSIALAEAGARVTYIHSVGEAADARLDHPRIRRVSLGGQDIWDRPAAQAALSGIWNASAAACLRRVLRDLPDRPDILHLHQWTRGFSPAVLPVLAEQDAPLAVTLHDYFLACPNGVYYRFDRDEPCALTPLSPACLAALCDPRSVLHKVVRVLRTAATRVALRGRSLDLVHVSDRGRDTILPFLPSRLRHHRVDNPVAAPRGEPARIGEGARIAYVGRFTREKGADLVARATAALDQPALFLGEGPLEAELRALNPRAEILGWRPPADLARLLATEVRAVAAPSRWHETGPLTVYEALAAGVPAVASERSGAAEKVDDGVTGFVVPPTVDALARAFAALGDLGVARHLGAAAHRAYWQDPPSPEAHARRLLALYESMLSRAPEHLRQAPRLAASL